MRRSAAALLALCALLAGCDAAAPGASASKPTGTLTVYAAASLTSTFTRLGKGFEQAHPGTHVRFSFGPSSGLAQQILAGAPADVFASASTKNMRQVTDAGDATAPETFATNVAEIAVAPGRTDEVTSLADLGRARVKVALCQLEVPCGALAQQVLDAARVTVRPVTRGLDVKSTLAYVTRGQVDAAIVYATDVLAAGEAVHGVAIPAAANASTAYEIARVTQSDKATLATAFQEYVLSPAGRAALTRAGFRTP